MNLTLNNANRYLSST